MITGLKSLARFFATNRLGIIITLIMTAPIIALFFFPFGDASAEIVGQTQLIPFMWNSIIVALSTTVLTLFIGIGSAWLVSVYDFPGKRLLELLIIFPKAVPAYIAAFGIRETLTFPGIVSRFFSMFVSEGSVSFPIHSHFGLIIVLALVLYPYVYLAARASFLQQSKHISDATQGFRRSPSDIFFTITLPLSRPALSAAASLVFVESLNEYAAASYLGVKTLTTELFRSWTYAYNFQFAKYGSLILLGLVLIALLIENNRSNHFHFVPSGNSISFTRASTKKTIMIWCMLLTPFLLGFVLPLIQLVYWSFLQTPALQNTVLFAFRSFLSATIVAFLCVAGSLLIANHHSILHTKRNPLISHTLHTSYAIPGAVLAIGIMALRTYIAKALAFISPPEWVPILFAGNSLLPLLFGLCARYIVVAYAPLYGAMSTRCRLFAEASRSLGKSNLSTLVKVQIPVMKKFIIATTILVFIDVLRDLPLTALLHPFNFRTLPVEVHRLIEYELVIEASFPALCLVFCGLLPLFFFARIESIPLCNLHKRNILKSQT